MEDEAKPDEDKSEAHKKTPSRLAIVTTVLTAFSALGVAYLGFQSKTQETSVKREEIAFQQTKFDAEQKNRDDEALKFIIPKILSKDEQEVKVGMATLFVLFPTHAREILVSVQSSLTEPQKAATRDQLQPALQRAQELETLTDKWIIAVGGDKDPDSAKAEMERAKHAGYSPTLYLKDGWFRTTIGTFPTQSDAERANIAVRATLRNDAYVVNLKSWCPGQSPSGDHIECGAK